VLTGLGLWLLSIPLSLGEMGGPINWAVAHLVVAGLMLSVTTYTARAKGALAGAICGILFSAPVAGACYLVSHAEATILREHGGQLRFAAIAAVAFSVLVMGAVAESRKTSHSDEGTNTKKF
jgi:hypothetical protein